MGDSIFDLTDKTGYESPWKENWVKVASTSSGSVNFLNSNRTYEIKKDILLKFKFYGYENLLYRKDYDVTLTSSNSSLSISSDSWSVENGNVFLTKVSLDKPATVKLYIAINGARKHTFEIKFVDSSKSSTTASKKSLTPLKGVKSNPLNLTEKQKAQFKAVALAETAHGLKGLYDICWIYFSRITDLGFEKGMSGSVPYSTKNINYKLWMYYLGHGSDYKDDDYQGGGKLSKYITDNGWFTSRIEPRAKEYIKFIDENVFIANPINKYKGWHGQGYWGDINFNPDDKKGDQWYMARQYYLLQIEGKVTKKYVQILEELNGDGRIKDQTSFIFDTKKIEKYFKDNPSLLPEPEKVTQYKYLDGKKFKR